MQSVTLDTIAGGALAELFDVELERVLRNIEDVNTKPTATRKITIDVTFLPNEDRDVAETRLRCVAKLEPIKTVKTALYMGRKGGKLVAIEHDPKQGALFDQPGPAAVASVSTFQKREGA